MKDDVRYKEIMELKKLGWTDVRIALKFKVSHQRIHQIKTGYSSTPRISPIDHKILTLRRRKFLRIGDFKSDSSRGGREFINEIVRARDNHTCQICKKKWKETMRRFDVHHTDEEADGKSRFKGILKYNRDNLDKLVTLCHKCHLNLDVTRERMRNKLSPLNLTLSPNKS